MIQHPLLPARSGAERHEEVLVPTYETIFIATPGLTVEAESATIETLSQIITDGGGSITVADRMGRRRLAYPIKKFDEGIYVRLLYDSGAEVPKELERRIRLSDDILRGLTVRLTPEWAESAKEQAVRDAERRAEAEAAEAAAAEAAAKAAEEAAAKAAEEAERAAQAEPAAEEPQAEIASESAAEEPAAEAATEEPAEAKDDSPAEPAAGAESEPEPEKS
jgi:small subunit ribosomal protein S6